MADTPGVIKVITLDAIFECVCVLVCGCIHAVLKVNLLLLRACSFNCVCSNVCIHSCVRMLQCACAHVCVRIVCRQQRKPACVPVPFVCLTASY